MKYVLTSSGYCLATLIWIASGYLCSAQKTNVYEYSINEGLPQSQVYAIEQDMHGYLWLGTQGGGLARFDGKNFEVFNNYGSVQSNFINCFEIDELNKSIYIGSTKGVDVWKKNKFIA
ncbi:MAG: hypothetical protein RLZZ546_2230, partial [Bacteroidota bacterium]